MGILNNLLDNFKKGEMSIAPNKKLKTISKEFKEAFDLSLIFYKGNMIADSNLTLAGLNRKTSKDVKTTSNIDVKIKASMTIDDLENMIDLEYGTKVQIKDIDGKVLIPNNKTLGQAARGEY
jgi:hypothetical protein